MTNERIQHYLRQHDHTLQTLIAEIDVPAQRIKEAMCYVLFPGGKRLRPLLVYLVGEIVGVALESLDIMAAAIELMHCYSLVHDDLPAMDNDDLRRGKLSCHQAFDEATAILVGDGLQSLAIDILLQELPQYLSAAQALSITHELIRASGPKGMVSGQGLDLFELTQMQLTATSEAILYETHSLKTGRLILACITMVLAASGEPSPFAKALCNFAHNLGLVFQMQDDYLDFYANASSTSTSDIIKQKFTFASLYDQSKLLSLITKKLQQTKEILQPIGTPAKNLLEFTDSLFPVI